MARIGSAGHRGRRLRLLLLFSITLLASAELVLQLGYAVLWWLGSRPVALTATRSEGQQTVLCLGDSFTHGMGASAPAKSYPQQLEHLLQQHDPGWRVVNRGWLGRNSRDVLTVLEESLAALRPQVVCILVGINDAWSRPAPLQLPATARPGEAIAPPTTREPFVFRLRLPRLLSTLRSCNPFRDHVDAAAPAAEPIDSGRREAAQQRLPLPHPGAPAPGR